MSWFSTGYEKVEQRAKEIDEAMAGSLPSLIIKDDDENVYVSFITGEPITYYEHFLPNKKRSFTCPDNGDTSKGTCPLCAMGNKPGFKGAYLVIDHRYEKWEKDGKVTERQHTLKIAKFGIRVLKSLQKLDAKLKKGTPVTQPIPNGILGVPFEIMRSGKGTDTQYAFNPLQPSEQHFPRKYQLEDKKTEIDTIVDNIKPKTKEKLMEVINGGIPQSQPQQSYGSPAPFGGQPQPPQGQGQPFGRFGGGQPQGQPQGFPGYGGGDDDDVINFG